MFCGHMLFHTSKVQDKLITVIAVAQEALFSLIVKLGTQCNVVSVSNCSWRSFLLRLDHNVFMCSNFRTALCSFRSLVRSSGSRY